MGLNRELLHIKGMITALFELMAGAIAPTHLALDGHFGNNYALQMARQSELHLVSKLRYDSALYLPYPGHHRQRKYGERIKPRKMPEQFLCECYSDKDIQTEIYQAQRYKYVEEVWKLLPQKPDPISWAQILVKVANLGSVHPRQTAENPY